MVSHGELRVAGLGDLLGSLLQTPWRVGENQDKPRDIHGEIFLPSF